MMIDSALNRFQSIRPGSVSAACASLLVSLFAGCTAPPLVKEQAAQILKGQCLDLFLNGSLGGYQHVVHEIAGKAVFALGIDDKTGRQRCGIGRSNVDVGQQALGLSGNAVSWEQLESIAIARCEASVSSGLPCKVFARNNDIVWNATPSVKFK
jgi:hypothetical protein